MINKKIKQRIKELQNAVADEDKGEIINEGSLSLFMDFLEIVNIQDELSISLTPDNNIYAKWKTSKYKIYSMVFFPDSTIKLITL